MPMTHLQISGKDITYLNYLLKPKISSICVYLDCGLGLWLGIGIKIWDCVLGLWMGIGIKIWDCGLGLWMGIGIVY